MAALHEFQHEFVAAGYRLYQVMPIEYAIPFMRRVVVEFGEQMLTDETADPLVKVAIVSCDYPHVKHFGPEHLAALHAFKHEVVAAGYRLNQQAPIELAAPVSASTVH